MIECNLYRLPKSPGEEWLIFVAGDKVIISCSDGEIMHIHVRTRKGFIDGNTFICFDKNNNKWSFEGILRPELKVPKRIEKRLKRLIKKLCKA